MRTASTWLRETCGSKRTVRSPFLEANVAKHAESLPVPFGESLAFIPVRVDRRGRALEDHSLHHRAVGHAVMRLYVPRQIDHRIVVSIGQETCIAEQVENNRPA